MSNINNTIYQMILHKKCEKKKSGRSVRYQLNSLKMLVPVILSDRFDRYIKEKKFEKIRRLIVRYKDKIKTNFGD